MGPFKELVVCVLVLLVGVSQGVLIVGPKSLRPNRDYTLVISNFQSNLNKVDLMVRLMDHQNGVRPLNLTKLVDVRQNSNKMITFHIPASAPDGDYRITVDGQRGFSFHKEHLLEYQGDSVSALLQLSKPVYKPGDTVQFRVIVLDVDLKPPSDVFELTINVRDSSHNNIRKWTKARLYAGVFENEVSIAPSPLLGTYQIEVHFNDKTLVTKTFEVKEYVLSTFDVDVQPTVVPLLEHQALNLSITASYYFGKPVAGTATLELYFEHEELDQKKTVQVNGMLPVHLPFNRDLNFYDSQSDVTLNVVFKEQYTNRTVSRRYPITVYKNVYNAVLEKAANDFVPGAPFKCSVRIKFQDGKPARDVNALVKVDGLNPEYEQSLRTDNDGIIKLQLRPSSDTTYLQVTVTVDDNELLSEPIEPVERLTNSYIKLELKSPIKINQMLQFLVMCSERMTFFIYYVVSKGEIIDSGSFRPTRSTLYQFKLNATAQLVPRSKIIVASIANDVVIYDFVDIVFDEFHNNFDLRIDETQVKPGEQIELTLKGPPRAYVGLASYDQGLLQYSAKHDIFRDDVWRVFDEFHAVEPNQFSKFYSMGLFVQSLSKVEGVSDMSGRQEVDRETPTRKSLVPYRTNFLESWLWKNVTIPRSGRSQLIERVPDTTTAWYLTGFSIDPVYGLGLIKKPIQFTTLQPFYIVDNLPYSIKRDEVVVLQFTLFNTLGAEYTADVTMYNVANQTEFFGREIGEPSYTKTLSVPPNVGVPVSFLVKAKKLGDMTVRVKASIMLGKEHDAIERVIRVLPESLVQPRMQTRLFSHNEYQNQSFEFILDIDKKADVGSVSISFEVVPNILTSVVKNLGDLLSVPTGCGEQNMVRFVPNIEVLDYLTATGSKETALIEKATGFLQQGYQNQMKYRQSDGSFGVWEGRGGSVFLTAFVGKSMKTAAKYITVDETMVSRTFAWLANTQNPDGRFDETGPVAHKDMQGALRKGISLTSYVMIAFMENPLEAAKHPSVIANGMEYLNRNFNYIYDSYDLAIATYAFWLNNHFRKVEALAKLIAVSTSLEGGLKRYWSRASNQIETTAYALLSHVMAEKYIDGTAIMRWLVDQRYSTGSFPRTQDTFVGLKALSKLAEKISPSRNDYSIQLMFASKRKEFRFTSTDLDQFSYEEIPEGVKKLTVNVGGIGVGFLEVNYQYSLNLVNFAQRFNLDLVKKNSTSDYVLQLYVCSSYIPHLTDERSNMALVEVNFPSGYVVDSNPISEATVANRIQKIEILHGGTSVVLYYNNMGTEKNCFVITAYRRFKVALRRPAYVKVHDYYDPNLNAIKIYEVDKQEVCDICAGEDCPESCKHVPK
ncbi:thioester-containing protein 1 allele S3-like [Anopheles bellator]|uniref:thioester-containing protein 1 allele S3-like n=1 Tax=Anopheles bellator TaxID=139047 RepID=UPI0026492673|nr:thioester-containing protein 1 allele S3-like [Anopheles bellator]